MSERGLLAAAGAGLAGLAVSAYLTVVHYTAVPLACSASGLVDCERVLTSPYAALPGTAIPTSAAGILWFAVSLALAGLQVGRPSVGLARLHLAWAAAGLAVVLYLVFVEIVRLGALCAWCTAAHALVLLTFLLVISSPRLVGGGIASVRMHPPPAHGGR